MTQSTANAVADAGGTPVLEDLVKALTREVSGLIFKFGGFLERQVSSVLTALFGSEDDKYPAGLLALKADTVRRPRGYRMDRSDHGDGGGQWKRQGHLHLLLQG